MINLGAVTGKLAVFVLLLSIVLLPIDPVFANEDGVEESTIESDIVVEEDLSNEEISLEPEIANEDVLNTDEEADLDENVVVDDAVYTTVVNDNNDLELVIEDENSDTSETEDATNMSTTTDENVEVVDTATSTDDVLVIDEVDDDTVLDGEVNNIEFSTTTSETPDTSTTTDEILNNDTDDTDSSDGSSDVGQDGTEYETGDISTTTGGNVEVVDTATSTDDVIVDTDNEVILNTTEDSENNDAVIDESDGVDDENTDNTNASSTVYEAEPQNIVFNDENKYLFSKSECISVGGGSFYCTETSVTDTNYGADGVYSEIDVDGDREIYIERGGETIQITDNIVDDDAPFYDELSNTVVWHRLIEGRYQIMEYSFDTGEERQLTFERYNNMQPSRYGDILVWQGWVGNDWEIMLEENGVLKMITDNQVQDIAPRINGNYIIWQSLENDVWQVKIYDTTTGNTDTISDDNGGAVENPRFVLVYDTKFENGDVETKGYDLDSGEVVPLSSTPAPLPKNIPNPEPTKEERALVQPLVQIKTKTEGDELDLDGIDTGDLSGNSFSGNSTTTDDVVIAQYVDETEVASTTNAGTGTTTVQHIEDLDVTTEEIAENKETVHIEDVIITPFVEEIATSTDSQEGVATST